VFFVAVVYAIWRFYTDFNRVLRSVKQDTVEKLLFPVSPGIREVKLDRGASRLAKRTSIVYRLLPFTLVAYVLAHCVLTCVGAGGNRRFAAVVHLGTRPAVVT
jgi:hypothetical protein